MLPQAPSPQVRPPFATGTARPQQPPAPHALGFALFVLLNALLFVRPADIIPALLGWDLYFYCIAPCLLLSFPVLLEQLSPQSLERRPITVCVLGLLLAVVLSHLVPLRLDAAAEDGWMFLKVVLYYLLFVGLVTTTDRLRTILLCLVLCAAAVAALAILQFHQVITLPNLNPVKDSLYSAEAAKETYIYRLQGPGLFNDPNELCVFLAVGLILALYWLSDPRLGSLRLALLVPLALFAYAMARTQSRGGMLALLAGLGVFMWTRFGLRRSLLLGGALLPVLLAVFAGRQTDLSTSGGTSQERIRLWADGLAQFNSSPLFGIGSNRYREAVGFVAHNSYVHSYVDLGLLGGFFFVGAAALALESFYRLRAGGRRLCDPEQRRLYPFLFGAFTAYVVGMLSLSLCYVIPTYTILALATVFRGQAATAPPLPAPRSDATLALRLGGLSIVVLIGFKIFVRVFVVR